MDKEKIEKIISKVLTIILIFLILVIAVGFPFTLIRTIIIDTDYDDVCKYNYGENYIFERDEYFGTYCIELIYENLTMENPEPFNWSYYEIREMCEIPHILDLTKWDSGRCHGEFALGEKDE